jgi:CoA-transferase family III
VRQRSKCWASRRTATLWRAQLPSGDAADLEEAIIASKGAGGMARTAKEWAKHPQANAIATLPLLEIIRIDDSDPKPLPAGDRPLSGIRVLDLTRVLAGPTCARTLAEHGADVLKITAAHLPNLGYQEWDTGHGKLSAQLDLRVPGDVETLRGLVRQADVFSQGYRPGTLANRGLSPEELAALRPGLVYVSLSAFGHTGPWASRRGFDTVVQTVSGMTIRQAEAVPGETPGPQFYPVSAIDYCTGYLMAFGAMVALARRAREGGSWLVRISLAQVGKWIADRGEVPAAALKDVPVEFSPAELEHWSMVSHTPSGSLRHLKPVVQLSETQPRWTRPSVPLGYHRPEWPSAA